MHMNGYRQYLKQYEGKDKSEVYRILKKLTKYNSRPGGMTTDLFVRFEKLRFNDIQENWWTFLPFFYKMQKITNMDFALSPIFQFELQHIDYMIQAPFINFVVIYSR